MESPYRHELEVVFSAVQTAATISRTVLGLLQGPSGTSPDADTGTSPGTTAAAAATFHAVKADHSPVTVADLAIQVVLLTALGAAFPAYGAVAEESADELRASPRLLASVRDLVVSSSPSAQNSWADDASVFDMLDRAARSPPAGSSPRDAPPYWVIDPIDGTQSFLRGGQYAINVALVGGGAQILGVVACPLLDPDAAAYPLTDEAVDPRSPEQGGCILFAVRGHGTYVRRPLAATGAAAETRRLEQLGDGGNAAAAAAATDDVKLRMVTSFGIVDSGLDDAHAAVAARLGADFPGCNLTAWVVRWAALALGLADVTVWVYRAGTRRAKVWDHAGAMLLFEEVGGVVTDVGGRPIDLARSSRTLDGNFGFVAAPRRAHARVLDAVRDVLCAGGRADLLGP